MSKLKPIIDRYHGGIELKRGCRIKTYDGRLGTYICPLAGVSALSNAEIRLDGAYNAGTCQYPASLLTEVPNV